MNRRRVEPLLLALIMLAALPAHGQRNPEPIELEADRAEMSQITGIGVYTGNVVLTQGAITITGERMTVHTDENRQLERVVVEGKPAEFEQRRADAQSVRARAPQMEYRTGATEQVLLTGGATLWQGRNEFSGESIHYDVAAERVLARGEGERRTRITFFPREGDETEKNR
jgi:lipopolysaccharide export system protein LptA